MSVLSSSHLTEHCHPSPHYTHTHKHFVNPLVQSIICNSAVLYLLLLPVVCANRVQDVLNPILPACSLFALLQDRGQILHMTYKHTHRHSKTL